jgi:hypothetical protein
MKDQLKNKIEENFKNEKLYPKIIECIEMCSDTFFNECLTKGKDQDNLVFFLSHLQSGDLPYQGLKSDKALKLNIDGTIELTNR